MILSYLDTIKSTIETARYEKITQTQISLERGLRKLKTPGFCLTGFLIMMLMPRDMKGLLKSMTLSLSEVMVIEAMAISASWKPDNTLVETSIYLEK